MDLLKMIRLCIIELFLNVTNSCMNKHSKRKVHSRMNGFGKAKESLKVLSRKYNLHKY